MNVCFFAATGTLLPLAQSAVTPRGKVQGDPARSTLSPESHSLEGMPVPS